MLLATIHPRRRHDCATRMVPGTLLRTTPCGDGSDTRSFCAAPACFAHTCMRTRFLRARCRILCAGWCLPFQAAVLLSSLPSLLLSSPLCPLSLASTHLVGRRIGGVPARQEGAAVKVHSQPCSPCYGGSTCVCGCATRPLHSHEYLFFCLLPPLPLACHSLSLSSPLPLSLSLYCPSLSLPLLLLGAAAETLGCAPPDARCKRQGRRVPPSWPCRHAHHGAGPAHRCGTYACCCRRVAGRPEWEECREGEKERRREGDC